MIAGYENLHLEKKGSGEDWKTRVRRQLLSGLRFSGWFSWFGTRIASPLHSRQQNREIMHRARAQHDARFCIAVRLTFGRAKALLNAAESLGRFSEN